MAQIKISTMNTQHIQFKAPLSFQQIIDIVMSLSPAEKQQLRDALWNDRDIDDMEIPEEHKQIVRERIVKYENSPDSYLSWNDIERKMTDRS
jgi:hypothetical protein